MWQQSTSQAGGVLNGKDLTVKRSAGWKDSDRNPLIPRPLLRPFSAFLS